MAFSTNQVQYLEMILSQNAARLSDYNFHYIAWNDFDNDSYDLHILLSLDEISMTAKGFIEDKDNYIFDIADSSTVLLDINTSNPSGYNPDLSSRLNPSLYPSSSIKVPRYSTISTNAYTFDALNSEAGLFGDILISSGGEYYAVDQKSNAEGLGVLSCLLVFLVFFIAFFRR